MWNWKNHRTKLAWQQSWAAPVFFWSRHLHLSMLSWSPGAFLARGNSLPVECCLKNCVPVRILTSDLLQATGFSLKHLGIWSLAVWRGFCSRNNRRNNMAFDQVFDQAGGWKNISWQRTFSWTKLPQLESQCGLSVWTCQRHLIAYVGQHCGKLYKNKGFQNT